MRIDEQLKISESQQKDKDGPTVSSAVSEDSVTSYGGAKANLPKLVIKKFYGEAHLWQEFWDSFKSSIDDNKNLSTIDKFNYLKNLLESNAYSTIAGLSLTAANYSTALDLLHKRYGQKQIIVDSHIDSSLKMQPLHYNAEIAQVSKFYDTVETHCRGLKALGVESSSYGTVLVNILLQRLPDEIKLIISRKMNEVSGDDNWNLDTLLDILKTEVEAREKCMITSRKQYPQGVPNKKLYRNTSIPATASALFASSKNRNQTCTFCHGQHPTAECHVVADIRERRNVLRRQGRCYLCLRKAGHLAKDCDVSMKCFNCRGRHHVALCERNMVRFGENKNAISHGGKEQALETRGTQSEPVKEEQQNTKPAAFCGISTEAENSRKSILLQTAVIRAVNPDDPNKSVNLRVIVTNFNDKRTVVINNNAGK